MDLLLRWLLNALLLLAVAYFLPGFSVDSFWTALIVALVMGIVNAIVKPLLIILTLPATIMTLGLFTFVINAFLLLVVASFIEGFSISGFTPALIGGIVLWAGAWIISALVHSEG